MKDNMKRCAVWILPIASLPLAVAGLLIAMGVFDNSFFNPALAFGLSVVFMTWVYYGYDSYIVKKMQEGVGLEENQEQAGKTSFFVLAPRIFLLGVPVAFALHNDTIGFLCGGLASLAFGADCAVDYRTQKTVGCLVFAGAFIVLGAIAIWLCVKG